MPGSGCLAAHSGKFNVAGDGLEARLRSQRGHERVRPHALQARVTQTQGEFERIERLVLITPLRLDRGVLIGRGVAHRLAHLRHFRVRIARVVRV